MNETLNGLPYFCQGFFSSCLFVSLSFLSHSIVVLLLLILLLRCFHHARLFLLFSNCWLFNVLYSQRGKSPIRSAMEHQGAMLGRHSEELAVAKHAVKSVWSHQSTSAEWANQDLSRLLRCLLSLSHEREADVPSVQEFIDVVHLQWCRRTWQKVVTALPQPLSSWAPEGAPWVGGTVRFFAYGLFVSLSFLRAFPFEGYFWFVPVLHRPVVFLRIFPCIWVSFELWQFLS